MPKSDIQNTQLRHQMLLKLLPAGPPGTTVASLSEKLHEQDIGVGKRQIQRDLVNLSAIHPIVCSADQEPGRKPFFWHRDPTAPRDWLRPTLPEAVSLVALESQLKILMPVAIFNQLEPRFRQAEQILAAHPNGAWARWPNKLRIVPTAFPLLPPQLDPQIVEIVQRAVMEESTLEITYQGACADAPRTYTLHPVAILQRGAVMYLLAMADQHDDIRQYALHRCSHAALLPIAARRSSNFDLDRHAAQEKFQFSSGKTLRLRLAVEEYVKVILTETPLSTDQKIRANDQNFTVTATVPDSDQLRWWILSFGSSIKVTRPKRLQNEIAATAGQVVALYALRLKDEPSAE